ncbi:hypothetical protein [Paraflavitalea speifideaquila]|uniref:hypothetical protein n=1 Tax=Paraflavitalea speifideaquila TaxID=3076558 RepID=UPI0028EA8F7C|nr:hypothetical protein [Paraflavitalea speifideiaquila]
MAKEKALQVVNAGKYMMLSNVVDVYDVEKEDFARQEIIFAFESDNGITSRFTNMMGLCGPANSAGKFYGNSTFGSIFAYQKFFNSFDPVDKRRLLLDTFLLIRPGMLCIKRTSSRFPRMQY